MSDASESLSGLLADLHAERVRTWAPEALKVNIDQRRALVETFDGARSVKVGDVVPPFTLVDVVGGEITRDSLVARGPAVLIFFRFAGCPACNIALPYYSRRLAPALSERGVSLVAISPQRPDKLIDIKRKHELDFIVASDPDNALGRALGVLYEFDEPSKQAALARGQAIGDVTGTGTWELPMPAVVIIGRDHVVRFVEVSPDWLVRTEADVVRLAQ